MIAFCRRALSAPAAAAVDARLRTPIWIVARSGVTRASPLPVVTIWGAAATTVWAFAGSAIDAASMPAAAIAWFRILYLRVSR